MRGIKYRLVKKTESKEGAAKMIAVFKCTNPFRRYCAQPIKLVRPTTNNEYPVA